jgi:putative flippase GtrA
VIVGGTSFVIDFAISRLLMFVVMVNGGLLSEVGGAWLTRHFPLVFGFAKTNQDAFFPIAATISASVAILNSFVWNRFWTFEIRGTTERFRQLRRFVLVSVVGLMFNVLIRSFFNHVLPFGLSTNVNIATVIAAGIVAVWNFAGQRYYAFRVKKAG